MKQRLGVIVGILAACLMGAVMTQGTASAATDASASAASLQKKVKKANKKAKATCKKVRKANGKKAKAKAKKRCKAAKKNAKRLKRKLRNYNAQFFDVCKHGCKYRTVQAGVNAAGKWQFKNKKRTATVRIQPGTYSEGVMLRGKTKGSDFDNLRIIGVKKNKQPNPDARQVILDGTNAKTIRKGNDPTWRPGDQASIPANNAIDAEDIDGLVLKNMWGRHYQNNTFFIWASNVEADNSHCSDFVMDNLVSSDTRSYGLFSRNCFGGKFLNSEGWNHGDSALYIGETPCDSRDWNNHGDGTVPCQKNPDWTLVKNFTSHQNVLGYSGTNSKYVKIVDSTFYNNGAGIVPNSLDTEHFGPSGWMVIENNDIFWNNYNYYNSGSAFQTVSNGLGEIVPGVNVNYPTGIGVVLYGTDGNIVRNNNIFGNEKWGAMSFSGPLGANKYDDAKNLNNQFINNNLGRDGLDPNGTDFLDDHTGGGSCYENNGPNPTYVLGNGTVAPDVLYPKSCPQPLALNKDTSSLDLTAGIQADDELKGDDPNTVLGYAAANPPASMECSWVKKDHPAFTDADGVSYTEARADAYTDC
ncbi:MAG: hypothetical protein KDB66_11325 [Solirubrobacterales bacterium]|nr:hypothetical protein [Solirubrobacterales bacterium]MCB8916000.1 hypothetical protein [Thermoleophilales bacterium]